MIGTGIATLASTTALAPSRGDTRSSAKTGGEFAETLDRALRKETPAGNEAKHETAEPASAKPENSRARHHDLFARTDWHKAAETDVSADGQEPVTEEPATEEPAAEEVVAKEARPDGEIGKPSVQSDEASVETAEKDQEDAAENADTNPEPAEHARAATTIGAPLAAAVGIDAKPTTAGAKDDAVEAAKQETTVRNAPVPAETRLPAAQSADVTGDAPVVAKAGETAAASVDVDRPRKAGFAEKTASRVDAFAVRAPDEKPAAGGTISSRHAGSSEDGVTPAARTGVPASSGSVQDRQSAMTPARDATTKSGEQASSSGLSEPRAARETATEPAPRSFASSMRPDVKGAAPGSAVDKPASAAPVVQMAQSAAATAGTLPSGQVAEAVARDLEELAPTRVAVSGGGAPGRPVRSLQLQLNPADLGVVNIRLHSVGGELRISIRAEADRTAEMLSRDSDAIRSALRAAGISTPEITISVNRNDQAAQQQFAGQYRDPSGQAASQDNRGNMSNESRNPNREGSSGDTRGPFGRGDTDSGDADRNSRIFI